MNTRFSCFCGRLWGSFDGEPERHRICHCKECKQQTGGPFSQQIVLLRDRFRVADGRLRASSIQGRFSTTTTRYLCRRCYSPIYCTSQIWPSRVLLYTGCITSTIWHDSHQPVEEVREDEKCAWLPNLSTGEDMSARFAVTDDEDSDGVTVNLDEVDLADLLADTPSPEPENAHQLGLQEGSLAAEDAGADADADAEDIEIPAGDMTMDDLERVLNGETFDEVLDDVIRRRAAERRGD